MIRMVWLVGVVFASVTVGCPQAYTGHLNVLSFVFDAMIFGWLFTRFDVDVA
jgi:hypothetical protein